MVSVIKDVSGFYIITLKDHIVYRGNEVSVMYTYNSIERSGGRQKYGDREFCEQHAKAHRQMRKENPDVFVGDEVFVMTSSKIHPYHVQRMIDTSDWVGLWHQAYVLEEPEALKRIESLWTDENKALDHFHV